MSEPDKPAVPNDADRPPAATERVTLWEHPEAVVLVEHLSAEDEDARLRAEADLGDWGPPPGWLEAGA